MCKQIYPALKEVIDSKWLRHICDQCSTRIVVLDGNAKVHSPVCAASVKKITGKGDLKKYVACSESPEPRKLFCSNHLKSEDDTNEQRLDVGRITRAKRKELGIHLDELTSSEGCRKKDQILESKNRSKTAGMLYAIRLEAVLNLRCSNLKLF